MRFSIIMPVLNEATILENQLLQLQRDCAHYDYELLIIDGGSNDGTQLIGQRYGQVINAPRGRALQMNMGASVAQGEILLFLHADTSLPRNALALIEQHLNTARNVGGAFCLRFDRPDLAYRIVAFTTNLRSRLFKIYTGDQAYFIRASSFKAVGGYPEQALMEDLEITQRLREMGGFILLPQAVTTSARRHTRKGLLQSIMFMWYMRTLYRFGVSPLLLQERYKDIR